MAASKGWTSLSASVPTKERTGRVREYSPGPFWWTLNHIFTDCMKEDETVSPSCLTFAGFWRSFSRFAIDEGTTEAGRRDIALDEEPERSFPYFCAISWSVAFETPTHSPETTSSRYPRLGAAAILLTALDIAVNSVALPASE